MSVPLRLELPIDLQFPNGYKSRKLVAWCLMERVEREMSLVGSGLILYSVLELRWEVAP